MSKNKWEKAKQSIEKSKQPTLDDLAFQFNNQKHDIANRPTKEIVISSILSDIKEEKLSINVEFCLVPSKLAFSRVNLDLYFEDQLFHSIALGIPQSLLLNNNFVVPLVLDMHGISAGKYIARVEMYEPWVDSEKLNYVFEEIIVSLYPKNPGITVGKDSYAEECWNNKSISCYIE